MKYERVTKKGYTWQQDTYCDDEVIYERLEELENKIENGTLIELNYKLIGETVYGIQKDTSGKYWFDADDNTLLGFTQTGIVTWNDIHGYNDWFENGFWFLTKAEAEAKLREIKGETK